MLDEEGDGRFNEASAESSEGAAVREAAVTRLKEGCLNHYEPTFKNIQKDLERLRTKQEVLAVDIATENRRLQDSCEAVRLEEMVAVTSLYRDKLTSIRESMLSISQRATNLRQRAERLQEAKQAEALQREIRRSAQQERDQLLIAKNNTAFLPETDSEDELPPGWEERATIQGDVYYANHDQAVTQWSHPRTGRRKAVSEKLPFGWERKILEDNKVVYVDHLNQRTTYTDPRLAFAVEKKSLETAFRQRFDASSTGLQVMHGLDLTGQLAIVTGASSGIGYHTARALAFHGCEVVLACRSQDRAEAAIQAIRSDRPAARCCHLPLDLASLTSVRQFVQRLAVLHPPSSTSAAPVLSLLVLNAGLFGLPLTRTEDGLETMMQVNYLGHFYLVQLLLPRLVTSSLSCRVVVLTSESHRFSEITPESISPLSFSPLASSFSSIGQYNDSKLFCLLFAQALHRRYRHLGLRCLAVHPGNLVYSGLKNSWWLYRILFTIARPFTKSLPQASSSVLFALCSPDLDSVADFTYINNCFPTKPSEVALSPTAADILWEMSLQALEQILGPAALLNSEG